VESQGAVAGGRHREGSAIEKRERISLDSCLPLAIHYMEGVFGKQGCHVRVYAVRRTRRHPMSSYGPAIEIGFATVGRENRFGLWEISAVDPLKLAMSNVEIPCHMLTVTLVIIGSIVSAHEKRDSIVDGAVRVTYGIDSDGHLQWDLMTVKERGRFSDVSGGSGLQKEQVENVGRPQAEVSDTYFKEVNEKHDCKQKEKKEIN